MLLSQGIAIGMSGMRKLLQQVFFTSLLVLLVGCHRSSEPSSPPPPPIINKTETISLVTAVDITGTFNVRISTGKAHAQVLLHGDARDLPKVTLKVSHGVLHVTRNEYRTHGPIDIEIQTHYLHSLVYHGSGSLTATNLHTRLLDVVVENPGQTTLSGDIGLRNLTLSGGGYTSISKINSPELRIRVSGNSKARLVGVANMSSLHVSDRSWLSMYWVSSSNLSVRGYDDATIQLAGTVDRLFVHLYGSSCFKGRYLRARRAFVKTYHSSIAEISAVQHQHALASDASDIQFYNLPTLSANFMAHDGAVLDMRDFNSPYLKMYDEYNK